MTISRAQMPRQLYDMGGVANLQAARDMLQEQALPGEFLAYINPQEAAMLKYMGGAGEPVNQSGIPSFFIKKIARSAKKAVKGAARSVKDFARSDLGQIALAVAAPYALGAAIPGFATLGGTGFLGNALRAGITNLATQGITTGRFDLGQAARTGVISGGITTGLQNYSATGNAFRSPDIAKADVSKASLIDTVDPNAPAYDFDGMTAADFKPTGTETIARDFSTTGPTFREAMAETNLQRGISSPPVEAPEFNPTRFADKSYIKMENISQPGEPFTSTITASDGSNVVTDALYKDFPVSEGGVTTVEKIKPLSEVGDFVGVTQDAGSKVSKNFLSDLKQDSIDILKDVAGTKELAAIKDAEGFKETSKAIMNYVKENPTAVIGVTSIISALNVPKQPDETPFDYEERMRIVKEFTDRYGEQAGVDTSGLGMDTDFFTRYAERAGIAFGGMTTSAEENISTGGLDTSMAGQKLSKMPKENIQTGGITNIPTGKVRKNPEGVKEIDYRDTGGFVPVGIKEKADDVPAMLSKNEFVFTADAVRGAGNGDIDKGAERLYKTMKTLENGGTV
jgi:hypothetical protein